MKKTWKTRLAAVGLTLVALVAFGAVLTPEAAQAQPCCSSCDPRWENCIAACNGDPGCEATCESQYFWCESHCSLGC